MTRHYPDLGSASDWSCHVGNLIQPMRSTTHIWVVSVISMEFLCSFFRRHLARKPVVASPNVGCFLGLSSVVYICCLLHIYAYSSECYLQRHCNRSRTLGLRSVHLTNSHLQICDLESYETTNLETQNYAESHVRIMARS